MGMAEIHPEPEWMNRDLHRQELRGPFGLERVGRNLKVCPPAQFSPKENCESNKAVSQLILFLARQVGTQE